jgi:GTP pyrophosphokinase
VDIEADFIKPEDQPSPEARNEMTRGTVGERFTTAVGFAREAHHGDVRKKTSIPYLSHLLAVSSLAIEDAAEDPLLTEQLEDIAIAAVLHDVVEDTVDKESPVTVEDVRKHFGDVVAQIVEGCTDAQTYPKPEWRPRKEVYIEHLKVADQGVLCVALADKRHNARCIVNDATRLGPEFWGRFNAGPGEQVWYYSAVTKVLLERRPGAAAEELRRTVEQLCDLAERASTRKPPE